MSLPSEQRHARFSRGLEFDICELQMGVFLGWMARGAQLEEERELFGADAWPYNIRDNLVVLEKMTRYAEMVGITERKLEIEELFVKGAAAGE